MGVKPKVVEWLDENKEKELHMNGYRAGRIFRLREHIYGILTKAPHAGGDTWSFLICGPGKGLVIDTGFGIGDLKGILEKLSGGKELIVVNTHFHGDHTLGNYQFEEVWISNLDAPILESHMKAEYWGTFCSNIVDHSFYEEEDKIPFQKYRIRPFGDRHVFDLGDGYEVETILMAGHSPGETAFHDKKSRILFTGDAVMNPFPTTLSTLFLPEYPNREYATVEAFSRGLENAVRRIDEYDCITDSHGIPDSDKGRVLDTFLCAQEILTAPDEGYEEVQTRKGTARIKKTGSGAVQYIPERVRAKE
jgi:glyoxylase-like metal-dependent hydrolase (beta-lactamase superfamily II)